jgi:hypothetical protein
MRAPLAFLLLLLAAPAAAQVPVCSAPREGMTACFDGRLCACRFERGGTLTGRPDGYRWDCGALRPDCAPTSPVAPSWTPPWPNYLPPPNVFVEPPIWRERPQPR